MVSEVIFFYFFKKTLKMHSVQAFLAMIAPFIFLLAQKLSVEGKDHGECSFQTGKIR